MKNPANGGIFFNQFFNHCCETILRGGEDKRASLMIFAHLHSRIDIPTSRKDHSRRMVNHPELA